MMNMPKQAAPILKRPPSENETGRAFGMPILFDNRVYGPKLDSFEKAFKVINGYRTASDRRGKFLYSASLPITKRLYAIVENDNALKLLERSEDETVREKALQGLREIHGDDGAKMTLYAKIREYDAIGSPRYVSEAIRPPPSPYVAGPGYDAEVRTFLQQTMKLIKLQTAFGDLSLMIDRAEGRTAFEGSTNYYLSTRVYCEALLEASDSALAEAGLNRNQISELAGKLTEKLNKLEELRTPAQVRPSGT